MAGRVNTRFVVILILCLVVLVGGLLGLAAWRGALPFLMTDPAENIARGQQFAEQGMYKEAREQFGKAVSKRPQDTDILRKFLEFVATTPVQDARSAQKAVAEMQDVLKRISDIAPGNPEPVEQLMQLYLRIGRELGEFNAWNSMLERSQSALAAAPDMLVAHKYRGIAQTNRMRSLDVSEPDREKARQDLEMVLAKMPDDVEVIYHLALWHLLEGQIYDRSGVQPEKAKEQRAKGMQYIQLLASGHSTPRTQMHLARLYLAANQSAEAMAVLSQLESQMLAKPEPVNLVLELADTLVQADKTPVEQGPNVPRVNQGVKRAEALLSAASKAHPESIRVLFALSLTLNQQRQIDAALQVLAKAREMKISGRPIEALSISQIRIASALSYIDLLIIKADPLTDTQARNKLLDEAQEELKKIIADIGDTSAPVNVLGGKLAMAQGKWAEATIKLDRASTLYRDTNMEVVLLSARVRLRAGEPGAAADRLKALLKVNPNMPMVRAELARIQLQLRQYDQAREHINYLTQAQPDDRQTLELRALLLAQTGQIDQAMDLLQKLDPKKNSEVALQIANLQALAGNASQSRASIEQIFAQNPKDLRYLQALLRQTTDKDQAMKYIAQARAGGADPKALDLLTRMIESKGEVANIIDQVITKDTDPLQRALQRYAFFAQIGQKDKAAQELEQATALAPDHPLVVEGRFSQALADKKWDLADRLAADAARLDLDLAKGMFFYGRLAVARNQLERAIFSFRKGLQERPIYSDGWRRLADCYRVLGDAKEAQSCYRQALEQRPNNVSALQGMAVVLDQLGDRANALEMLRLAVQYAPGDREMLQQYLIYEEKHGNVARTLSMRRDLEKANPDDTGNQRAIAMILARQGQVPQARQIMDQIIKKEGMTLANLAADANLRMISGDLAGARQLLTEQVVSKGDKATTEEWLLLSQFLLNMGEIDNSIEALQRATLIEDPAIRPATRALADLLFDFGAFEQAIPHYQKLFDTVPQETRVGQRYVETLLRSGNIELAEKILSQVIATHGEDANTYLLQGLVARAKKDDTQALALIQRARELAPSRALVHYQYAEQLLSRSGREKDALDSLARALELDPNLAPARMLLARTRLNQLDSREAIRELQLLLKNTPNYIPARMLLAQVYQDTKQDQLLNKLLNETVKLFPRNSAFHRMLAQQAEREGKRAEAYRYLQTAVDLLPSPDNLGELTRLLLEDKQLEQAMTLLQKHMTTVERSEILLAIYARGLASRNDLAGAVQTLEKALVLCDNFRKVALVNEQLVAALGAQKVNEILEPLALKPEHKEQSTRIQLAIALNDTTLNRFQQTIKRLDSMELLLGSQPAERNIADRLLAMSYHRLGNFEQAERYYQQLYKNDSNDVHTLNNLAYLLVQNLNRNAEGLRLASRAFELSPRDPQVLDTLGWAQFKAGLYEDAVRTLRRSLDLLPQAATHYHLGEVYLAQEDRTAAVRHFEQAQQMADKSTDTETLQSIKDRLSTLKN